MCIVPVTEYNMKSYLLSIFPQNYKLLRQQAILDKNQYFNFFERTSIFFFSHRLSLTFYFMFKILFNSIRFYL